MPCLSVILKTTFMQIRPLEPSEAELFHTFRLQGLRESPEAFSSTYEEESALSPEMVRSRFSCTDEQFVLGAFDNGGELIGVGGFYREKKIKLLHRGSIWGMYVTPEKRSQGAGRALVLAIIERCRNLAGMEQIVLDVIAGRDAARNLYLSQGFQSCSLVQRVLKHNGEYYDVEQMVLYLQASS